MLTQISPVISNEGKYMTISENTVESNKAGTTTIIMAAIIGLLLSYVLVQPRLLERQKES
jgi:hypothetical protein